MEESAVLAMLVVEAAVEVEAEEAETEEQVDMEETLLVGGVVELVL